MPDIPRTGGRHQAGRPARSTPCSRFKTRRAARRSRRVRARTSGLSMGDRIAYWRARYRRMP
ncbi:MAG: hypothetical protein ACRDRH_01505 [Pseudonocardia sp.]